MKIGINLLYLVPNECGGTETYGVCLVNALIALDSTNEYVVFLNRESKSLPLTEARNLTKIFCNVTARHRPLRYLYEQLVLPILLIKHRIELVHSLGYVAPLLARCVNVVSVHDMNYIDLRQNFPWFKRMMLTFFSTTSIRLSDHVITISKFSKSAICQRIDVSPSKVSVTYLGPGWLGKAVSLIDWNILHEQYDLPEKYIVAFGGGSLHKNIPRLIEAYLNCEEIYDYALVIMGHLPPDVQLPCLPGQIDGPNILCLGYVPTEHIQSLLAYSALFVLPSLYEGFGLPILEAQFANTTVASSNAASLPEIGGEGAIYFDPLSVPAISEAIKSGLKCDASQLAGIRKAAKSNTERFSWEATAESTLEIYRSLYRRKDELS